MLHDGAMRRVSKLPSIVARRSFTLQEGLALGVSRRRLQAGDLLTASRGIRVPWDTEQCFAQIVEPVIRISPEAIACWGTAARLWNLPIPAWMQGEQKIHLATMKPAVERFGVVGHRLRLRDAEKAVINSLPLTSVGRTWLDLAPLLSLEELVALGDAIVCSHHRSFGPSQPPFAGIADLKSVLDQHKGARGIRAARAALTLVRVGADSPPETYLRLAAVELGLPEPELNLVILDDQGRDVAWPDLAFKRYLVALQYDGEHHLSVNQQASDARRDNESAKAGWLVLKITKTQVRQRGYLGIMREIRAVLVQRGWHP